MQIYALLHSMTLLHFFRYNLVALMRRYAHQMLRCLNPSVTARVKISQNVDILAKVYLAKVYLVQHCQTLHVVSTFTGQNKSTVF